MKTARQELERAVSEDDLLATITEWATLRGWLWHHVRRSDKALQMGSPGFPDLCLIRDGRVVFLELKSEAGRLTQDQWAWLRGAGVAPGTRVAAEVLRPSNLDAVIEKLR